MKRPFHKPFSFIMSNNKHRYQPSVAVSGNLEGKIQSVDDVLSSHEKEIYPSSSLDENNIEFEFQTDLNCYVDLRQSFLALKLQFDRGRGFNHDKSKENRRAEGRVCCFH